MYFFKKTLGIVKTFNLTISKNIMNELKKEVFITFNE